MKIFFRILLLAYKLLYSVYSILRICLRFREFGLEPTPCSPSYRLDVPEMLISHSHWHSHSSPPPSAYSLSPLPADRGVKTIMHITPFGWSWSPVRRGVFVRWGHPLAADMTSYLWPPQKRVGQKGEYKRLRLRLRPLQ
jgi:hypothetical protein